MKKNVRGFTLVELIVVVAVISVLSLSAVVFLRINSESADDSVRQNDIQTVEAALGSQTKIQGKSFADTSKNIVLTPEQRVAIQDKNLYPPSSSLNLHPIDSDLAQHLSLTTDELMFYAVDDYNRVYYLGFVPGTEPNDDTPIDIDDDMDVEEIPVITPRPTPEPPPAPPEKTEAPDRNGPGGGDIVRERPDPIPATSFSWQKYVEARVLSSLGPPQVLANSAEAAIRNGFKGDPGAINPATAVNEDYFYDVGTSSGNAQGVCFEHEGKHYIIVQSIPISFATLMTKAVTVHSDGTFTLNYDLGSYFEAMGMVEVSKTNFDEALVYPLPNPTSITMGTVCLYNGDYYVFVNASGNHNTTSPQWNNAWVRVNNGNIPKSIQ